MPLICHVGRCSMSTCRQRSSCQSFRGGQGPRILPILRDTEQVELQTLHAMARVVLPQDPYPEQSGTSERGDLELRQGPYLRRGRGRLETLVRIEVLHAIRLVGIGDCPELELASACR